MALQEYETIRKTIDKNKTWINVKYKQVISREITSGYYNFVFKYNSMFNSYMYYIIIGNDEFSQNKDYRKVYVDDYGRGKMSIPTQLYNIIAEGKHSDFQISIEPIDNGTNYTVYEIGF